MIQEFFQKWIPADNLGVAYDVENIAWGGAISVTLVSDKKRTTGNNIHRFQLAWDASDIISYHVTDETYRADCWTLDFENDGRFYMSQNSDYIENFKQKSPLFPNTAIHFLMVGTNTIVDVLAKTYPTVTILE